MQIDAKLALQTSTAHAEFGGLAVFQGYWPYFRGVPPQSHLSTSPGQILKSCKCEACGIRLSRRNLSDSLILVRKMNINFRAEWNNAQVIVALLVAFVSFLAMVHWGLVIFWEKPWQESLATIFSYRGAIPAAAAAVLTLGIATKSLSQKSNADDRSAYYERVQWAIDMTLAENPAQQNAGWHFLTPMLESGLKSSEDIGFTRAILEYDNKFNPKNSTSSPGTTSKNWVSDLEILLLLSVLGHNRDRKESADD
ncbi:hypothetical protein [Corynebacterium lipophilum]|uniref:hypothetical protein n=1 Tax=Corynebacterium lipophilum TaxID=2804918 RepID=UPI002094BE37|nr:hypothetical protein [Corynebacterium lipophilum]